MPFTKKPKPAAYPEEVKRDPVEFARRLLKDINGRPLEPHVGQCEFLHGIERLTVACCGRQWGKSVACGILATWFAVTKRNKKVWIIAPSLQQARIIFDEVARHFDTTLSDLVVKRKDHPFPYIKLANGTEIHARGANSGKFIRGNSGHLVIIDEAAFVTDDVLQKAIVPLMTVTGKEAGSAMVYISTPFGKGHYYETARLCRDKGRGAFFHFPSESNPHADKEFLAAERERYGADSLYWRTEFLAELDGGDDLSVFPSAHIEWAFQNWPCDADGTPEVFPQEPERGREYVQGVDLANLSDYFVSTIIDTSDPHLCKLVHYDRYQRRGWDVIKETVRGNWKAYNQAKTCIDATSLGWSVVDDLKDIRPEGYAISSSPAKMEIVNELRRMLAEHRLVIPNDPVIIRELRYFQFKITPSKNLKAEAADGHDDIVMSLCLAAHLASLPHSTGFFQGVSGFDEVMNPSSTYGPWKRLKTAEPAKDESREEKPYYDPFAEIFARTEED
jgi:hypothetical protein